MLIINQLIRSQGWSGKAGRMNNTLDATVDTQNIEACHRLKSDNGRSNKAIVKFNKRKDIVWIMNKKKSLTQMVQVFPQALYLIDKIYDETVKSELKNDILLELQHRFPSKKKKKKRTS